MKGCPCHACGGNLPPVVALAAGPLCVLTGVISLRMERITR